VKNAYDDIINLHRPISKTHPQMPISGRAAQFSPFAALTGHSVAIEETARLTDRRIELDEAVKLALNDKLQIIAERIREQPEIQITYFQPDEKKAGGAYITAVGTVKKMDEYQRVVRMSNGTVIPIDEIIRIEWEVFEAVWMDD
jgi:hypothetical protein